MSDCTRCGTETNNPAIEGMGTLATGILEGDEWNGVAWLCDECAEQFRMFLRNEAVMVET